MKSLFNHKKGFEAVEKSFYYAIFSFVLVAVLFLFGYYVGSEGSSITKVPKNLNEDLFYSLIINTNCFAYQNLDSGRTFVGTIDWDKFNQHNLDQCFYAKARYNLGYRITLRNMITGQQKSPISTPNFKTTDKSLLKKIKIIDNNNLYDGELKIEVQKIR